MSRSAWQLGQSAAIAAGVSAWLIALLAGALAQTASRDATTAAGGGVTLHSIRVQFPEAQRSFAGDAAAEAINNNCLICHSAGMVLTQPVMSKVEWKDEVEKMRSAFHAPVDPNDVDVIADYLASLKLSDFQQAYQQVVRDQGNLERGAAIAAQGISPGVPACAQCHAFDGASDGSGAFPRIAGQSKYYLAKQIRDFASVRVNAIMSPFVKALSLDDIADVSAYYASAKAPFLPLAPPDASLVARGRKLAEAGDTAKGVTACENCHGPRGAGEFPAIPYLGGQYARYIAFELQMWRKGYRKSSPEIMAMIANKLEDQDIAALAAFYQQLPAVPQTTASK